MAQTYFPFDAGAGANSMEDQWTLMAAQWLGTGVIKNDALGELVVSANASGMQVFVAPGKGWVQGHFYQSDAQVTLAIAANASGNPRIDRVVLQLDKVANTISLVVLQGTPAASPVAPTLTQTFNLWQISLARVAVANGAVNISAVNVTDERTYATAYTDRVEFSPPGAGGVPDTFMRRSTAGGVTISAAAGVTPLTVVSAGTGTGDLVQLQDNTATPFLRVGQNGNLTMGHAPAPSPSSGASSIFPLNVETGGPGPTARFGGAGVGSNYGLTITPYGAAAAVIASGAYRDASGNSVAQAGSATQFEFLNSGFFWYGDVGLTSGSTYTRTARMTLTTSGMQVIVPTASIGTGAGGAAAHTYVNIGEYDPNYAAVSAAGANSVVNLLLQSQGTGQVILRSGANPGNSLVLDTNGNAIAVGRMEASGFRAGGDPGSASGTVTITGGTAIGNGASTNLVAPAKGTGGGPATLSATSWIKTYVGLSTGYIPFFQ